MIHSWKLKRNENIDFMKNYNKKIIIASVNESCIAHGKTCGIYKYHVLLIGSLIHKVLIFLWKNSCKIYITIEYKYNKKLSYWRLGFFEI